MATSVVRVDGGEVEYRLDRRGERTVVVLHGGHMRASIQLGEDDFANLGCTVLVPSRPGYGATPTATGTSPDGFADSVRDLCDRLGIDQVAAVVGISAGGPTAVALAARHPDLVQRLILESSVGARPWPGRRERIAGTVLFNGIAEGATWAAFRALMRVAPVWGLRAMFAGLSTRPAGSVVASLDEDDRRAAVELFSRMRSGRGFSNDLRHLRRPTRLLAHVDQPSLVVATRYDASVPFAHADSLTAGLRRVRLVVSEADSHLLWFGSDRQVISEEILRFLTDTHDR